MIPEKKKTSALSAAIACISLLMMISMSHQSYSLKMLSGDQLTLDTPVQDDDVFASGGTVNINAPVASAVIAGSNVNINAPVSGDLFVAGGQVSVNSNVGGKIVATAGSIDLRGNAKNVVAAGGTVNIHPGSIVAKDAFVAGGTVNNAGEVVGKLVVSADNFQNTGKAGEIEIRTQDVTGIENTFRIIQALLVIGFGVLGVVLLKLFPAHFIKIDEIVRKSTVKTTVIGFLIIIASAVAIFVSAVTVVGLPIAIVAGFLFIIGLMLAGLFVAFTFGKKIIAVLKLRIANNMLAFVIGFVVLALLYLIPYAGQVIQVIVVSLGFGALFYGLRQNWASLTSGQTA